MSNDVRTQMLSLRCSHYESWFCMFYTIILLQDLSLLFMDSFLFVQNAEPVIKTPENGTGISDCGYDNGKSSTQYDISDSNTDLCDSDSVELQSDSKTTLVCKEPVSPCVTISQFERKVNSENSDQLGGNTAPSLSRITQKTVINLDEEESGEEEQVCRRNHPDGSGGTIIGNALRSGLSNLHESGVHENSLSQNDNYRTREGDRVSDFVNSTKEAIPADDTSLVVQSSSDEEQPREFISERGESSCLQHRQCSEQSFLKKDGAFAVTERLGKCKQITEISPEIMASGHARPLDGDGESSDEVIDVTPNFDVDSPEIAQIGTACSTAGMNQSNDDYRTQFCRSSSPVIPRLSPEFLPPSYDVGCRVNRSPGSLKRKTLFSSGSLPQHSDCIDKKIIDGKSEYNHPSKKLKLGSSAMEISPLRTNYGDLESKSPRMHNSDKAFSNRSRCSEERSPQTSCKSDSHGIQQVEGDDDFRKMQHSSSYLDCFDDGGFNPDINYENLISSNYTIAEADSFENRRKEIDEENDKEKDHKSRDNVIEIHSETDMLDFSDDGGFNSDAMQYISPGIETSYITKKSSGNSLEVENSERSTLRTNRIGPGHVDVGEPVRCDALSGNTENLDHCNNDSLLAVDEGRRGTSKSKTAAGKRRKQQKEQKITINKSPAGISLTATQTPCNVIKAFGPGCSVHPETGAAITPMSDYDSLQTPILAVSS